MRVDDETERDLNESYVTGSDMTGSYMIGSGVMINEWT